MSDCLHILEAQERTTSFQFETVPLACVWLVVRFWKNAEWWCEGDLQACKILLLLLQLYIISRDICGAYDAFADRQRFQALLTPVYVSHLLAESTTTVRNCV